MSGDTTRVTVYCDHWSSLDRAVSRIDTSYIESREASLPEGPRCSKDLINDRGCWWWFGDRGDTTQQPAESYVCVFYVPILVGKDGSHPTDLSHDQGNQIRPIPSLLSCDSLGGITQDSVMWNSTLCCSVRQFLISSNVSLKRSTILVFVAASFCLRLDRASLTSSVRPSVLINSTSIKTVTTESPKHQHEIDPTRPRHVWCKKTSVPVWDFDWLLWDPTCTLRRFYTLVVWR